METNFTHFHNSKNSFHSTSVCPKALSTTTVGTITFQPRSFSTRTSSGVQRAQQFRSSHVQLSYNIMLLHIMCQNRHHNVVTRLGGRAMLALNLSASTLAISAQSPLHQRSRQHPILYIYSTLKQIQILSNAKPSIAYSNIQYSKWAPWSCLEQQTQIFQHHPAILYRPNSVSKPDTWTNLWTLGPCKSNRHGNISNYCIELHAVVHYSSTWIKH